MSEKVILDVVCSKDDFGKFFIYQNQRIRVGDTIKFDGSDSNFLVLDINDDGILIEEK